MKIFFLYASTILIWGSTWFAIKFQIDEVDPMVSVVYRFSGATALLFLYCRAAGRTLSFSAREHGFMALQGALLFSLNYWLVYVSELYLTSGLVAVLYSMLVFLNVANGFIFMRTPVKPGMIIGAVIGIIGVFLIFWPEISAFSISDKGMYGLLIAFISLYLASLGNIASARNQKHGLPILQTNAFAMGYGVLLLIILSLVMGKTYTLPISFSYIVSMLYLTIFGTIIAFWFYLTLLGKIGADRAAYAIMVVPVVALGISTFFEGYQWSPQSIAGAALVLAGNLVLLKGRKKGGA
ncbi:MAG: DMT family transporter [Desulfobacterales bacterium]|nr:DMT family transporter [Desulfobacterales bacterium]